MRNATALALTGATTTTTINGNSRTLFDAWFKLDQISQKIDDEFQKVFLNQAQQIATADPATFDVVTFVTGWTQQTEGYRSSTNAVSNFRTELNKVMDGGQHSDELIQAAKEKRQALKAELDKRNEADAAIEKQIATLDKFIKASSSTTEPEATGNNGRKRGRKRTLKSAKAASKGGAGKKAAKKRGKK